MSRSPGMFAGYRTPRHRHADVGPRARSRGPRPFGRPEQASDLYRIGTALEDRSITRGDALMACSANIADFTTSFHGVDRAAIDVVHCCVDAEAFDQPRRPAQEERPTVLFVGNLAA